METPVGPGSVSPFSSIAGIPAASAISGGTATMGAPVTVAVGPDGSPYGSPEHHYHQAALDCPLPPSFMQCHVVHTLSDVVFPLVVVGVAGVAGVRAVMRVTFEP